VTRLTLRPGHDRRLRSGHPWIFSNEIASLDPHPANGAAVEIYTAKGECLGSAYYNGHSLIAARRMSRQRESIDSLDFFRTRFSTAAMYRRSLYGPETNAVRLVFGESDGLPGLVVDRYAEVLAVQLLTLGMEHRKEIILAALLQEFTPRAVVWRNDAGVRELEGLTRHVEMAWGEPPGEVGVGENGLSFLVDVCGGQKTGHFLDQKENHRALDGRVEGHRVLDLFCYSGSWSIHAARYGAKEVIGVDISAAAITLAERNAHRNELHQRCRFVKADVFDLLRELERKRERFGTIILDPPAFVKSKKKLPEAIKGYLTINRRAMELLEPGGFLFTCSCSYHMDRETFLDTLRQAAAQAGRECRLVEMRGQAFDHPVLLACPETDYLKCAVLQVL